MKKNSQFWWDIMCCYFSKIVQETPTNITETLDSYCRFQFLGDNHFIIRNIWKLKLEYKIKAWSNSDLYYGFHTYKTTLEEQKFTLFILNN